MSDKSSLAEQVALERQEGTWSELAPSVDPIDQIFDKFKSCIDNKLGAFKSYFCPQDDSPDSESKGFKREIEANKLQRQREAIFV